MLLTLGGSVVIFIPACRMEMGNSGCGELLNHSRKSGWGSSIWSCSTNLSSCGIQLSDKWQFARNTQLPCERINIEICMSIMMLIFLRLKCNSYNFLCFDHGAVLLSVDSWSSSFVWRFWHPKAILWKTLYRFAHYKSIWNHYNSAVWIICFQQQITYVW